MLGESGRRGEWDGEGKENVGDEPDEAEHEDGGAGGDEVSEEAEDVFLCLLHLVAMPCLLETTRIGKESTSMPSTGRPLAGSSPVILILKREFSYLLERTCTLALTAIASFFQSSTKTAENEHCIGWPFFGVRTTVGLMFPWRTRQCAPEGPTGQPLDSFVSLSSLS